MIVTAELRSLEVVKIEGSLIEVTARLSNAPSPAVLKVVARAELQALSALLAKTGAGESVHGARRRIKRLRSLLRLLRVPLGEEAFKALNGALRDAADALAVRRRAEALVGAAERLGGSGASRVPWIAVAELHRQEVAAMSPAEGGIGAARASVAAAAKALSRTRLERGGEEAITMAFISAYRKARRALDVGFHSGQAEDLHEARKHVIHHIHHVDVLGAHLRHAARRIESLEKLREALGDLNDLDELSQLAASADALPEASAKSMAKRRGLLLKRAEAAARRLFRHKPEAFRKRIGAMWTPGGA